jgi:hypothetical protein
MLLDKTEKDLLKIWNSIRKFNNVLNCITYYLTHIYYFKYNNL